MQGRDRKWGKVGVQVCGGKLRLTLPRSLYGGKQKHLSLSLDDTPRNRLIAEAKAVEIEKDIERGEFDTTLNKYRPEYFRVVDSPPSLPPPLTKLDDLVAAWKGWLTEQRRIASPSTKRKSYRTYDNYFKSLPTTDLEKAYEIRDHCLNTIPADSCKRFIVRLSAACKWGIERGVVTTNPFQPMIKRIIVPVDDEDMDIHPFTAEERKLIMQAIRTNQFCSKYSRVKHSYYADFIELLFKTGCRPSEAIALRKRSIKSDHIHFTSAVVYGEEGWVEKQGLKTQRSRKFPINESLRSLLTKLCEGKQADDLLFKGPESGGFLNSNNIGTRVWGPVLEGLGIEHRKMYQTRHTFITEMVNKGVPVANVAKWCGNSVEVILEHYLGFLDHIQVPDMDE